MKKYLFIVLLVGVWSCEDENNNSNDKIVENDDITPPTVQILTPSNEDNVFGIVKISVEALGENGIERVEFFINDSLVFSDNNQPYEYDWETDSYANNSICELSVIAYDTNNNESLPQSVNVIIFNFERFVYSHGDFDEQNGYGIEGYGYGIRQHNNEYLIGGELYDYSNGESDFYLFKIDSDTNTVWHKRINHPNDDHIRSIAFTDYGEIILAGRSTLGCQDIMKFDNQGNSIWSTCYSQTSQTDIIEIKNTDLGFIALSIENNHTTVWKINDNGESVWNRNIVLPYSGLRARTVTQINSGEYIVAGEYINDNQIYIAKISSNGESQLLTKYYNYQNSYISSYPSNDGGFYLLIGYESKVLKFDSNCNLIWEVDIIPSAEDQGDLLRGKTLKQFDSGDIVVCGANYIAMVSDNGNFSWYKSFDLDFGLGFGFEDVDKTTDGGYVITGTVTIGSNPWRKNILVIKTDPNGNAL